MLYSAGDYEREQTDSLRTDTPALRPPFRRDYARLIHSPAFRRLQGKTQLFPGVESDFFRNRLTHSIEVAQIAKSIAIRINATKYPGKHKDDLIDLDLVEFAGLAHDLGHPPFGHTGEHALDECMKDAGGFEGNAQTLRILARLEKKGNVVKPFSGLHSSDDRIGLNLTYRALAAVLKYDQKIPERFKDRPELEKICKGYFASESGLIKRVKRNVIGSKKYRGKFSTIECQIMDLADDIAYSTYDLEDALKAGFVSPLEIIADTLDDKLMAQIAEKVQDKFGKSFGVNDAKSELIGLFIKAGMIDRSVVQKKMEDETSVDKKAHFVAAAAIKSFQVSQEFSKNGYLRTKLTSYLVDKFINGVEVDWNRKNPIFSKVEFSDATFRQVETLKNYTFQKFINSSRLKVAEYRGNEIVTELFKTLADGGSNLLPDDFRAMYEAAPATIQKKRVVCDFIAGMTDRYIIEFYGRLNSESPQTIFKPL